MGEKEGTFTNIEFRTSRIEKLVPSPGQTVSDWEFITSLMNFAGLKKVKDRADIVYFLRAQSDNPAPLP